MRKIFSPASSRPCAPDAAQRVALAERCAADPGSRLLATRRNRGPGSAKRHEECRIAPGTRGTLLRSVVGLVAVEHALERIEVPLCRRRALVEVSAADIALG